jgi:hypothetical protein
MPLLTGPAAASSVRLPAEVQYVVDASDVLVEVNDAWSAFAIGNGAPHLEARHVLGRSLWTFIADDRTCELYRSVMRRVREGGRSEFHFRCDSPEWRRYMLMSITRAGRRRLLFDSVTLRVEPCNRPPPPAPRLAVEPVRICSWCMSVYIDDGWVDPDTALSTLGLFATSCAPGMAHGICPLCFDRVMDSVSIEGPAAAR